MPILRQRGVVAAETFKVMQRKEGMFRSSSFVAENKEKNFTKPPRLFIHIAKYDTDYAGTTKYNAVELFKEHYILKYFYFVFRYI